MKKTGEILEGNCSSFNEWTRNHVWFRTHYQRLARSYDRQNIAVYETGVIDHDKNLTRLLSRVKKNYPVDGLRRVRFPQKAGTDTAGLSVHLYEPWTLTERP
jgi:hypothetical protein